MIFKPYFYFETARSHPSVPTSVFDVATEFDIIAMGRLTVLKHAD